MPNAPSDEQLVAALLGKPCTEQRRALAKAITLLESTRLDHRTRADQLLNTILPHTGRSFRLGISGVPGVGKSTLIENLGLYLISKGHRVAVLAIDPSSSLSGGSILGDKTRMELLSVNENAFIRPSPSSGTLGGVAERTREVMLLAEAAGHDVVIVETVGQKVSEVASIAAVRDFAVAQQQAMGIDKGIVMDGRDIGTVVFPNAELKLFVTADPAIRLERRYQELLQTNPAILREEVAANLQQRDLMDSTRAHSPLKQAEDALVLDNTNLDRVQQFELAMQWAMDKIKTV